MLAAPMLNPMAAHTEQDDAFTAIAPRGSFGSAKRWPVSCGSPGSREEDRPCLLEPNFAPAGRYSDILALN
jgi:hypothetical protein